MSKSVKVLLVAVILAGLIGCSSEQEIVPFNDKNITMKLINSQSNNEFKLYDIEIENKGNAAIEYISFYLAFPIKHQNGTKSNPFKLEGKTDTNKPIKLQKGEKVVYNIFAPIKEVFGQSDLLDYEHPSIELKGFVRSGDEHIPFGMSGSMEIYLKQ
ncbi:hypothetical protein [Paenibacillus contaminans]|uniref:Lipoprotein n=1 Tax=Paenibacillus contaminans TaxID=450362 RepID=A0A329MTS6_9BACL|nr:hypothetical protein [Paenibacillus contaminans]RAV21367.1 hypothetical protein DQG23_11985 [Paenibacillus contaminans]